jgi:hypothetical protein
VTLSLVSLDCPSCGSALHGQGFDTLFFCSHCGDAAVLDESGLQMVDSGALVPAPGRVAEVWKPAWLLEAEVDVRERILAHGRRGEGWQGRRRFVVPAFDLPLTDLARLARSLGRAAAGTSEVPRQPIRGGTLALDDAVTLVRHVLIGDEVRRSDMLASVEVILEVTAKRLVAIPFEKAGNGLRCAITGVNVAG